MSFNTIIPHPQYCLVEAVIDGYEDWQSAMQVVEEISTLADEHGWNRFLIDFTRAVMRVSESEAPDIAAFFNSFYARSANFALRLPADSRAESTVRAFGAAVSDLGHGVTYLKTDADRVAWMASHNRHTRTG